MAAPSRTAQFTRLSKILKKYYQPVAPDLGRSVFEHLLFACLLENAPYAAAEEALAALVHTFFDWNEIRVSSVRELSEVIAGLPQPSTAAHHVKRVLQSVFEATYSFDLEDLRKQNLGPAVERLQKIDGTTPFAVAYAVQAALGGHSIPVDAGTLRVLLLVGLISERDAAAGVVPGLERAIAKNAGMEFGSLLHQLGADFVASPYTPSMHEILLEITPEIKDRLPRRRDGKPLALLLPFDSLGSERGKKTKKGHRHPEGKEEAKGKKEAKTKEETKAKARGAAPEPSPQPAPAEEVPSKSKKKPAAAKTKPIDEAGPKPAAAEPVAPPAAAEPAAQGELPGAKKKAAAAKKKPAPRKPADPVKLKSEADPAHHDSGAEGLSKRKPR
jgi:endonuclease III